MPPASQFSTTASPNLITSGNMAAGIFPGLEPDVAAAAYAALSAVVSSNDQGNLIDPDLLVKILSDPKLIEKLVADHRAATCPQITPMPRSPGIIFSEPPSVQIIGQKLVHHRCQFLQLDPYMVRQLEQDLFPMHGLPHWRFFQLPLHLELLPRALTIIRALFSSKGMRDKRTFCSLITITFTN